MEKNVLSFWCVSGIHTQAHKHTHLYTVYTLHTHAQMYENDYEQSEVL